MTLVYNLVYYYYSKLVGTNKQNYTVHNSKIKIRCDDKLKLLQIIYNSEIYKLSLDKLSKNNQIVKVKDLLNDLH